MVNITLKNIPEEIYKQLRKRAKSNERSINGEILFMLKRHLAAEERANPEDIIREAREFRKKVKGTISLEELEKAINEGRP